MFFYPDNNLDLDRLHQSVERLPGPLYGRATGKTTAYLFLMLGAAQVCTGDEYYVYIGPTRGAADMVMQDFCDLLYQEHIEFKHSRSSGYVAIHHSEQEEVQKQRTIFRFYSADNAFRWPTPYRGARVTQTYLDVSPDIYDQRQYIEGVHMMHIQSESVI